MGVEDLALLILPFWSGCAVGAKANVPNEGRLKLFFKMCSWEIFKNIWVGLNIGKAGLCQDTMNSPPCKSPLTCQVAKLPDFYSELSRLHVLRLPVTIQDFIRNLA